MKNGKNTNFCVNSLNTGNFYKFGKRYKIEKYGKNTVFECFYIQLVKLLQKNVNLLIYDDLIKK